MTRQFSIGIWEMMLVVTILGFLFSPDFAGLQKDQNFISLDSSAKHAGSVWAQSLR